MSFISKTCSRWAHHRHSADMVDTLLSLAADFLVSNISTDYARFKLESIHRVVQSKVNLSKKKDRLQVLESLERCSKLGFGHDQNDKSIFFCKALCWIWKHPELVIDREQFVSIANELKFWINSDYMDLSFSEGIVYLCALNHRDLEGDIKDITPESRLEFVKQRSRFYNHPDGACRDTRYPENFHHYLLEIYEGSRTFNELATYLRSQVSIPLLATEMLSCERSILPQVLPQRLTFNVQHEDGSTETIDIDRLESQSEDLPVIFEGGGFKNGIMLVPIERFPCVALRSGNKYNFIELDNFSDTYEETINPFDRALLTSNNIYLVTEGASAGVFNLTSRNPVSVLALQKRLKGKPQ